MAGQSGGLIGTQVTLVKSSGGNNESKFTSPGTWSPCASGTKLLDVVIVAGGGGGGGSIGAPKNGGSGGGGAGGVLFIENFPYTPPSGNKSVTIGGGGAGNAGASASGGNGTNGSNSVWGCYTATGGGGGGGATPSGFLAGSDGGSGGGGMGGGGNNAKCGGDSTQSDAPGFPGSAKANDGGTGNGGPVSGTPCACRTGGGGGGASAVGPSGSQNNAGGAGLPLGDVFPASAPFGDSNVVGGGGGGGQYSPGVAPSIPSTRPAGGVGVGGDGAVGTQGYPCAPEPLTNLAKGSNADGNTGGGGGGGSKISFIACTPYDRGADSSGVDGRGGGNGGSGIVLVKEKNHLIAPGMCNINEVYEKVKEGDWSNSF